MKLKVLLVFLIVSIASIFVLIFIIYFENKNMVPILTYHSVEPSSNNDLTVEVSKFERQLKMLKKLGYKTLSLDQFLCWKNGECDKPNHSVLITFDDGYLNNYEYAFKLLKEYDFNAVVFYLGINYDKENTNYMNIKDILKIKKEYPNIEFASHTFNLHNREMKNYEVVKSDSDKMKSIIDTKHLAYPYGEYDSEYIRALKDSGYEMAFTFGPGKEHRKARLTDDNYKIPRLNISNNMPMWKFVLRLLLPI